MEREAIKEAVKEAFQEELKAFYIDRETHYKQHEWLASMITYCEQCKSVVLKTIVTAIIAGTLGLLWLGFSIKSAVK
jgi:archaellum component FlaD/FlaE